MKKMNLLRGGELLPYLAPEVEQTEICVERGFLLSDGEEDWTDGELDDDSNDLGSY